RNVCTPQVRASCDWTTGSGANATIAIRERYRLILRAVSPLVVNATKYRASISSATVAAARQMTPLLVLGRHVYAAILGKPCSSVDSMIRAIVRTATAGNSPMLVSPDNITASVPSSTALATSEASARVGCEIGRASCRERG